MHRQHCTCLYVELSTEKSAKMAHQRNYDDQIIHTIFGSGHVPCDEPEYDGYGRDNRHNN